MQVQNGILTESEQSFKKRIYNAPKNILGIGSKAFKNADSLKYIFLPKKLLYIGDMAFYGCSNLKKINIPKNVGKIGKDAFAYCTTLKSASLPEHLIEIQDSAFYDCLQLKNIKLPKNLEKIGNETFRDCRSLKSIDFSENLTHIGANAFTCCTDLTKIELPDSLTYISSGVFESCYALKSVKLPNNLETLADNVFYSCDHLENIDLPNSLKFINNRCFSRSGLKEIQIPDSVEFIGEATFSRCKKLRDVKLSKNLSEIEKSLFKESSLTSITLPESLKEIGDNAFDSTLLKEIQIPDSVEFIGQSAFCFCQELEHVKLPKNLKEISIKTFENCVKLKDIEIPNSLEEISAQAFYNCKNLKTINLSESVKRINSNAFSRCENLESINLPKNIDYIGSSAFEECFALKNITLPENLTEITNSLFKKCSNLERIEIPQTVEYIEGYAFTDCINLKEISLPDQIVSIGPNSFENCKMLENIILPKELKSVSDKMFKDCLKLKEVNIPKGVTYVGKSAFENCKMLEKVEIPNTVKCIDDNAFENCNSLNNIFIPDSVKTFTGLPSAINDSIRYLNKVENGYILSDTPSENSYDISALGIDLKFLGSVWENKELVLSEQRTPLFRNFYNEFLNEHNDIDLSKDFVNSHNFTFFKQFKKFDNGNFNYNTYKFLYNLGIFEPAVELDNKKVDYAQKVTNFLIDKLNRKETSIEELSTISASMNISGFNREFSEFFMRDFNKLMQEEKSHSGFIAKCYNEFEEVQATNTSHRGSQRQLQATAEKFVDYFKVDKFKGVTPETEYIANAIAPYFQQQHSFDKAVKIVNEMKEHNIPTRILKSRLIDETSPFKAIQSLADNSETSHRDTLHTMTDIATSQFSFEWLEKNDPINFYLGKLCNCCAHLEGQGYSIMRASMIHENIQNLVLRNKKGEIVAKSTIYVHPKEGYAVFNNVEIADKVNRNDYQALYEKYIESVKLFAERYNLENPNSKLKKINVGMGNNDLEELLAKNHESEKKLLEADYARFGSSVNDGYNGDSRSKQVILWVADSEKKSKKNNNENLERDM